MFAELFNVVSPVLLISLIGFIWVKKEYEFPTDFITRINMNLGAPCLVFIGLLGLRDDISAMTTFMFASLVAIVILLVASAIFVYMAGLPKRGYIIALSSSNCGNMGIPLCLFAFGNIGMSYAIAFYVVGSIFQYTVSLLISHGNMKIHELLRLSILWGIVAAAYFIMTGTEPPIWLMNTTELLAGIMIPLMLLALGASLARLQIIKLGKIATIGAIKMAVGIGIGIVVANWFGYTGVDRNVLILQMSMPVAVFSYLLAARYNRNPDEVASLIFTTTLMSFALVPLMLLFLF
ncbi:AEC family transporter [Pseudemcibacter aquimaris]|uniref:AEC family transporter n=1 Tax=Pseudemcibacter aquimaris TaxID=2857064 RepID=UPI002012345A|nr:AEC family transporter [Pseudemcibacter aquimaris]MCC3860300.1 AEC family transporter [Pseudemcibacter aquimaris]WDU57624.1 AEC family transporter [Pseudemcibacter aquimaris]